MGRDFGILSFTKMLIFASKFMLTHRAWPILGRTIYVMSHNNSMTRNLLNHSPIMMQQKITKINFN